MTQRSSRRRGRRPSLAAALVATAVGVSMAALPSTAGAAPAPPKAPTVAAELGKQDRDLVAQAVREGKNTVDIQVMADEGVVAKLTQAGAKIRYRADNLGYIRAEVPINSVDKVATLSGIEAINVDRTIKLDDPRPEGMQDPSPQPAPGANTPRVNPYMPTG